MKTRGTALNPPSRFIAVHSEYEAAAPEAVETCYIGEQAKSIINQVNSPDIPYRRTLNPYRGCEHGCSYCFARPTHNYLDYSSGLDFESRIIFKENAVALLEETLSAPRYQPETFVIGTATDPYQPLEQDKKITRDLLQVCLNYQHPVSLITKGALISRDLDILAALAINHLVSVAVSVTTLNRTLKNRLEPRASHGTRRLQVVRELASAGVPVTVLFAPVIPFINDNEMEDVIAQAADAGAQNVSYVMLRLPHDLKLIWRDWLATHYPDRAERVIHAVQSLHEGRDYRSDFGIRQRGSGAFAELFAQRFQLAARRSGLEGHRWTELRSDLFRIPSQPHQLALL